MMTTSIARRLETALFGFFALFVFASTFSIALAQTALGVALALFLALTWVTRHNPFAAGVRWFYMAAGLYIAWLLFTSLVGPTPLESMRDLKKEWLFLVVPIGIYLLKSEKHRARIISLLAVGVILVATYGIIQHFTGTHWFKHRQILPTPAGDYRAEGNFSIAMTFGNYFGTVALFLLGYVVAAGRSFLKKRYYLIMSAAVLGILAATASMVRGMMVAMILALVALGLIKGKRHFHYLVGLIAIVALLVVVALPGLKGRFTGDLGSEITGQYEGSRIFIWENSLKVIRDHPLVGVGLGNFKPAYVSYLRKDVLDAHKPAHAHNDFLNTAAVSGIPGAVILAGLWAVMLRYFWRGWRGSYGDPQTGPYFLAAFIGSLTFLVSSFTEATFIDEEVRQLLMFIWAVGLWPLYNKKPEVPADRSGTECDAAEMT